MAGLHDTFAEGALPYWNRFAVGRAWVVEDAGSVRFVMGPAPGDSLSDAELNDHRLFERGRWPWRPPLRLTIRARASHRSGVLIGTAGFGFWNSPFTFAGDVVDSPQAVWFFYASPPSHMSLSDSGAGSGWRAQVLNAPRVHPGLISLSNLIWRLAPLRPFLLRAAQAQVGGGEAVVEAPLEEWHTYRLEWLSASVQFFVDGQNIASVSTSPRGPLGFVAWLDNSMLSVRGSEFAFANLAIPEREWFELGEVRIDSLQAATQ